MTDNTYLKAAQLETAGVQNRIQKAAGKSYLAYRALYFTMFCMTREEEIDLITEIQSVKIKELIDRHTLRLLFMHEMLNDQS